ncbi:MAG: TatD DNase family protein [Rhodothermales bacterium]|jgi:TatD DNase family protein
MDGTGMLIDTHTHTYLDKFDDDRAAVFERARAGGVQIQLLPAIDIPSIHAALKLARSQEGVFVMAALHPSDTKDATDADFAEVARLAAEPEVVAIGETGLDYYWDKTFNAKQQDFLRRHIRLAAELDLPLVFHNREASEDLVAIVAEEQAAAADSTKIRGVFHCFGGTPEYAAQVMALGFHVGLGGTLTFKNGGVPDAIVDIPMDRIVLETDAPFLAPVPFRGKRNEPAHVRLVAQKLAELRGLTVEEVAAITTSNAMRLFRLPE